MIRYNAEDGRIQVVLTGDSLITRSVSAFKEPPFLALVEMLRNADVAVTNAETLFHNYEGAPAAIANGTYLRADPSIIKELQWMGINLFSAANNHQGDFGENGMMAHLNNLRSSGVTYAGIGETLAEAREPHYLETDAGRVALISCTSSGPSSLIASHQWRDGKGRPGANMLRHTTRLTVDEPAFEQLKRVRDGLGLTKRMRDGRTSAYGDHSWGMASAPDSDTEFYLGDLHTYWQGAVPAGCRVVLGEGFETHLVPVDQDIEENLQRISDARRSADWVIVSMHNHEQGETPDDPSDIAVLFAHAAIDAGADIFHGHGPHRDRGIEIYKGKPIFYSLGTFFNEVETVSKVPLECVVRQGCDPWEAVPADFYDSRSGAEREGERIGSALAVRHSQDAIAIIDFVDGGLSNVCLQPIELGFMRPRYQRGRPVLGSGNEAQQVLALFQDLSKPFGTEIEVVGDVGRIRLDK